MKLIKVSSTIRAVINRLLVKIMLSSAACISDQLTSIPRCLQLAQPVPCGVLGRIRQPADLTR